ncbi:hypothetical protein GCM10010232_49070 [Streptomyces amakusaensis]
MQEIFSAFLIFKLVTDSRSCRVAGRLWPTARRIARSTAGSICILSELLHCDPSAVSGAREALRCARNRDLAGKQRAGMGGGPVGGRSGVEQAALAVVALGGEPAVNRPCVRGYPGQCCAGAALRAVRRIPGGRGRC